MNSHVYGLFGTKTKNSVDAMERQILFILGNQTRGILGFNFDIKIQFSGSRNLLLFIIDAKVFKHLIREIYRIYNILIKLNHIRNCLSLPPLRNLSERGVLPFFVRAEAGDGAEVAEP